MYDSLNQLKGPGGEERLEKSRVQMIPGREGASNSVFSAVAMCLGQTLGERGQSPRCPGNSRTIISEASLLGKEKNVTGPWTHGCLERNKNGKS